MIATMRRRGLPITLAGVVALVPACAESPGAEAGAPSSSAGVAVTTTVRAADGIELTVPSLLAVATDQQRMVFLQQTGAPATPLDQAAFTALFQDAFEAQQNG